MSLEILLALYKIYCLCSQTKLYIDATRAVEVTGGAVASGGVTVQGVKVKNTANGKDQWYEFVGVGLGVSLGPSMGASFSAESLNEWGGSILKGPAGFGTINFDDLTGSSHIFSISAAALETKANGIGVSLVTFGEVAGEAPLCSALTAFAGTMIAVPGAGIMCYKGAW